MKNDGKNNHCNHRADNRRARKPEAPSRKTKIGTPSSSHVATSPLERVELKHFQLDVTLHGDETGYPLGRPWVTTAVDEYSQAIVGYFVGFDPPDGSATGMCISHSILPKQEWLRQHETISQQRPEWPCHGVPRTIRVNCSIEQRVSSIVRLCERYGVTIEFGRAKKSAFVSRIERLMRRMAILLKKSSEMPSSHDGQHSESECVEGKRTICWREFKHWLAMSICGIYNNRTYPGLGEKTPLERWKQGFGEGIKSASTSIARLHDCVGEDAEQLRIDFLPSVERTISWRGVLINSIWYRNLALLRWIDAKNPKHRHRQRVFVFRYDPQDVSIVYFWNPTLKKYEPILCCDLAQSPMTLWEWRAIRKRLKT